jgi:hypothetical protein
MRGPRLAKARRPDWSLSQPWLEPWHQEQHRWSEDYARKAAEWEERDWLVASMPPDVRAACDAAQKASHDQLYQALGLSAGELEVLCLNHKHEQVLTAAGTQVRITAGSAKAGRLFWPAAQTDSKQQAPALFAKARYRCAARDSRPTGRANERNDMTESPDRESALSRDLAGVNCALVKIVDADDRYYVLVGEPELYRDGFRLQTSDVLTLSQAEDWCRQEIARQAAAEADSATGGKADEAGQ